MTSALFVLLLSSTLFAGFLVTSQVALFSLTPADLKSFRQDPKKQSVIKLLNRPRDLLVTLLFCDIGANILVQNCAANIFSNASSWLLKVGVPLVITLFLGEIFPKTLALPFNTKIAHRVAPTLYILRKTLGPIRHFITAITTHISRNLFFFLKENKRTTKEEMDYLLKSSEEAGVIDHDESGWISGYLNLGQITIKERMHPRDEILFYNINQPLSKLIQLFKEANISKIPVCRGELQNVLGVISSHDFLSHQHEIVWGDDLLPFLQKPFYAPETTVARTLLHRFFEQEKTMALVIDEYGLISGLITSQDLYEVVIGKIEDRQRRDSRYSQPSKDVLIASGKLELSEFSLLLGSTLPSENHMVTIGGWLTEQLGEIPKCGTTYRWGNFLFQVLASEPNRIRRVYIRKLK